MSQNERDVQALGQTIYGEARGEPIAGQYAVAHTVLNRQRSNKSYLKGNTIEETCKKPYQFACWNVGDVNRNQLQDAQAQHYQIAREVMSGSHADNTYGATHYHADYAKNAHQWAHGKNPCVIIGHHHFYNNID